MAAPRANSHQYLWLGLTCLWNPLKFHQEKPGPFGSRGTNTLQYIIRQSSQATWNAEREAFEGRGEAASAAYLLRENIQVPFFLLEDLASLTHSFPCLCRVSTFLPRSDGYNSRQKPAYTTPTMVETLPCMKCTAGRAARVFTCLSDNTAAVSLPAEPCFPFLTWLIPTTVETVFLLLPLRFRNALLSSLGKWKQSLDAAYVALSCFIYNLLF